MRKIRYCLLFLPLLLAFAPLSLSAEGIAFFHGTWEEAMEKAAAEDKVIFVDAYTTWCGPCKRMAATVFTKEEVGSFFNENFICMKIDMEKDAGIRFQQKYPVSAFPTLYFIDDKGKAVHKVKGAQPVDKLLGLGRMVLNKVDKSVDLAVEYDAGKRDPELIFKYVKALRKAGKPSGQVANEYLKGQKDLSSEFNLRFLLMATAEADSRIFSQLIAHKNAVIALESAEAFEETIEKACEKTAQKAVEFNSPDLLDEAKDKMKKHLPGRASTFAMMADLRYYKGKKDTKNYLKACNTYVKKVVKNNASGLHDLAQDIHHNFEKDAKAMAVAEKYSQQAAENGGLAEYYTTYASILLHNKKKAEALAMAKKSLDLAKGSTPKEAAAIQLIRKIEREG